MEIIRSGNHIYKTKLAFFSFEELINFIRDKEEKDGIKLRVNHSRTIDNAINRGLKRPVNENLKYYNITFNCVHGGVYISTSKGARPNQRSQRIGCPFRLRASMNREGNALEIVDFRDEHNHITHQADEEEKYNITEELQGEYVYSGGEEEDEYECDNNDQSLATNSSDGGVICEEEVIIHQEQDLDSSEPEKTPQSKTRKRAWFCTDVKRKRRAKQSSESIVSTTSSEPPTLQDSNDASNPTQSSNSSEKHNSRTKDEFDIFGENVACCLRNLDSNLARAIAKHEINNILFNAEMGSYSVTETSLRDVVGQVLTVTTSEN